MKNNIVSVLIIIIISIAISLPLLKPGLHTIHDDQQIARLYLFDLAFKGGQFPVRWVSDLGFGFGYPLFVFYPPLVYMVGELFHLLGFSFVDSIKIVFYLSFLLSGLAMYILAKEYYGKLAATVSSVFYMLAPYRALDVYVRGALAEAFSFVWFPVIIFANIKIFETSKTIYVLLFGLSLGLLMITHNLMFLPFILLLFPLNLFLVITSKNKIQFIAQTGSGLIAAMTLSAFFWIPAIFEKKFTIVDELLIVNLASYKIHFVYLEQLWNWTWGFGGSTEGIMDGISFKIGKLHVVGSTVAFCFAAFLMSRSLSKKLKNILIITAVYFALFIFSAYMTLTYSEFIWDLIAPLAYLQFPWRFLAFTALFSSLLIGALVYLIKLPTFKLLACIALITLVVMTNIKLFKPQFQRIDLTDQKATSKELINWDVSSSSYEYVPKGVPLVKNEFGANKIDLNMEDIPKEPFLKPHVSDITISKKRPSELVFYLDTQYQEEITANVFDFPGWHVYIDDIEIKHTSNNKFKLITFTVPSGQHKGTIKFENTMARTTGNAISVAGLVILALYLLRTWRVRISN